MVPEVEGGLVPLDDDVIAVNAGAIHYEAGTASVDITVEVAALEQMSSLVLKAGEPTAAPSVYDSRMRIVPLEIRAVDATGEWRGVPCEWQVSKEDSIVLTGYTSYDREDIALLMPSGRTRTISCRTGTLVSQELTITVPAAP